MNVKDHVHDGPGEVIGKHKNPRGFGYGWYRTTYMNVEKWISEQDPRTRPVRFQDPLNFKSLVGTRLLPTLNLLLIGSKGVRTSRIKTPSKM